MSLVRFDVVRVFCLLCVLFFFFKQKTAYEMRISDWSSDVCSSDLPAQERLGRRQGEGGAGRLRAGAPDAQDVRGGFEPEAREVGCGQLREIGRASCRESGCQYV